MKKVIATWNVNSLNVRLEQVLQWITQHQPDIFALQETKVIDEKFPVNAFQQIGYQVIYSGQPTYNGVAIISKAATADIVTDITDLADPQRRILAATIDGIRVINVYVPNGQSLDSDKYSYKLHWLEKMRDYLAEQIQLYPQLLVLGDFNIAPTDLDVHDPQQWQGQVLVSAAERQAFQALLDCGLTDSFRLHHAEEQQFSWWDYRALAFRRNHGLRIDHILISQALVDICQSAYIDKELRKSERPSDHTVVVAEFNGF